MNEIPKFLQPKSGQPDIAARCKTCKGEGELFKRHSKVALFWSRLKTVWFYRHDDCCGMPGAVEAKTCPDCQGTGKQEWQAIQGINELWKQELKEARKRKELQ